jgi:hypothetical protein
LSALAIFGTIAFIQKLEAPKFSSFGGNNNIIAATCNHFYLQLIKVISIRKSLTNTFFFSFNLLLSSSFCQARFAATLRK